MPDSPTWLDEAAAMPVAFALVREDPELDLKVLQLAPKKARILMIASGGCTAAFLAAQPNANHIHVVDPNPSQLALTRLKWHLLRTAEPAERKAVLGHAPMDPAARRAVLEDFLVSDQAQFVSRLNEVVGAPSGGAAAHPSPAVINRLGPIEKVAELGPDHAGRYELLFARLREVLRPHETGIDHLLSLDDPLEQTWLVTPGNRLGDALDAAYDEVLALPNLVRLFGEGATQNPVEPFSRHFIRRTRLALINLPAVTNPYLWLMLKGQLPPKTLLPWLELPIRPRLRPYSYSCGFMADVMDGSEKYHFIHLSNILDWLTPEQATDTLERAAKSLYRGGHVFIRQLNSTLDIPALGMMFSWETSTAGSHVFIRQLNLARDRSFFYRALHLGRKR